MLLLVDGEERTTSPPREQSQERRVVTHLEGVRGSRETARWCCRRLPTSAEPTMMEAGVCALSDRMPVSGVLCCAAPDDQRAGRLCRPPRCRGGFLFFASRAFFFHATGGLNAEQLVLVVCVQHVTALGQGVERIAIGSLAQVSEGTRIQS